MKSKKTVIKQIKESMASGAISENDLKELLNSRKKTVSELTLQRKGDVIQILYYIGAGIVVLGVAILFRQNWEILNSFTRILATLVFSLVCLISAYFLGKDKKTQKTSTPFYFIGSFLLPIGLGVVIHELGVNVDYLIQSYILFAVILLYLMLNRLLKKSIFRLFIILFSTWLFFSITNVVVENTIYSSSVFNYYRFFVTGVSYILLGYYFSENKFTSLATFFYIVGSIFALSAALFLGDEGSVHRLVWEMGFSLLVSIIIYLSVYLRRKLFLIIGAIYILLYIIKITASYFTEALGWPVALIGAGLAMIGVGFLLVFVNDNISMKKIHEIKIPKKT
jgi:hypothetical protein